MTIDSLHIESPAGSVSVLWSGPQTPASVVVYAPGAGSHLGDPFGAFLATALGDQGIACLRFQFPYSEAGRTIPDRPPVLEATWRAALELARGRAAEVIATGRSMGGRIASQVVAQGEAVSGLALFAYPLHPPGKPEQRRDAHLPHIDAPVLFCSGDRDTFATVSELQEVAAKMPNARLEVLSGADHGFAVLKASGRRREDVWEQATASLLSFMKAS